MYQVALHDTNEMIILKAFKLTINNIIFNESLKSRQRFKPATNELVFYIKTKSIKML